MKEIKEALEYAKLSITEFGAEVLLSEGLIDGILTVFSKVEEMQKTLESVKSDISFLKNDYPNELWTHQETARWESVADDAIKEIEQALKGDTK